MATDGRRGRPDPAGRRRPVSCPSATPRSRPSVPTSTSGRRRSPPPRSPGPACPRSSGSCSPSAAAALVGFVFSPVASRLRGIYLGLATLGLVFLVRHLLLNLDELDRRIHRPLGGAVRARRVQLQQPRPRLPRHRRRGVRGPAPALVPVPRPHAAWPRGWPANLRSSRTGRAWANVRDSETAAAAMGIAVARHKASAFVVSSGYAGLAGALLALAYGRIAPDVVQPHRVRRLPGHDRAGRPRLGGRCRRRCPVRHGPAAGAGAVQRLASPSWPPRAPAGWTPRRCPACSTAWRSSLVLIFLRGGLAGAFRRLRGRGGAPPSPAPPTTPHPTPPPTDPGQPAGPSPSRSKETAR